ncbi:hypothetical protein ACXET9_07305 [Brachybacterium sp. DNPG3]
MTGAEGWTDWDRLLVLALSRHDMDLCPSGAGPAHYRDECDIDRADVEPEAFETQCIWLHAADEWHEERRKTKNPDKGVLMGLRDAAEHDGE